MALPPKFAAHRLVFADGVGTASTAPLHTIEVFLDYVCPFSAKIFNVIYTGVAPELHKVSYGSRFQFIFRHQVQPWHPSSTLVHEAGLYVQQASVAANKPELFWAFSAALFRDQAAYMDVNVVDEPRNATYKRLGQLAETSTGGVVTAASLYEALAVPNKPDSKGAVNVGNSITDDLKVVIKMARLVGVHVSPTVLVDGVVNNNVSSSWTTAQWLELLEKTKN